MNDTSNKLSFDFVSYIPHATSKNGKPKGRHTFQFPSFDANVDVCSFLLSYKNEQFRQVQPDEEASCDLQSCHSSSRRPLEDWHVFTPFMRHVHQQLAHVSSVGFVLRKN